jgi:hypothetical protein
MESGFGRDFGGVRIHTNDTAARAVEAVDALAYTVGQHVVFGRGRYTPHTPSGLWLLAHELAHTVQQGGEVGPGDLELEPAGTTAEREADSAADSLTQSRQPPGAVGVAQPSQGPRVQRRLSRPVVQRAVRTICQPPGFWLQQPLSGAFGLIAGKLIEADYLAKMGVAPPATAYVDSSFVGPIDPALLRFIVAHNPGFAAWKQVFLAITPVRRPDIIADDGTLREYEEVKTDSIFGITDGFAKLLEIRAWMSALGLPYVRGTAYSPTPTIPFFASTLPSGIPFNLSLAVRRESDGLIVYKLCIETDFLKLALAAVIIALIAAIIILLPKPVPVPIPVPLVVSNDQPAGTESVDSTGETEVAASAPAPAPAGGSGETASQEQQTV